MPCKGQARSGIVKYHAGYELCTMYRVLCVDDEPAILEISKLFLERTGTFSVDTAESAEDALRLLVSGSYDAVVSDYQMPGTDGIFLLQEIRGKHGDLPFILFTGRGREEVVVQAIDSGADFYLQKGGDSKAQYAELAHKIKKAVERKKAWEAVRTSEEKYRELVENANNIILKCDRNGNITFFNEYAQQFFGFTNAEILGSPMVGTIVPPTESGSERDLAQLLENIVHCPEEYTHNENENIKKNGERVWIQWWNKPLFDACGAYTGMLSIGTDMTAQKKIAAALTESEERYRFLVENAPLSILVVQGDRVRFVNQFGLDTSGYTGEEIRSRPFLDFVHPEDRGLVYANLTRQMRGEKVAGLYSFRALTKSGESRWYDIKSVPVTWNGEPATMNYYIDVSERKSIEDTLHSVNGKLLLLSRITRHDLGNQITALRGFIDLSRAHAGDPGRLDGYLERMESIAGTLSEQLQFTRDYGEIDLMSPQWLNLGDVFEKVAAQLPLDEVSLQLPEKNPDIYVDPLFSKVCYNLIEDSLRYGGEQLTEISVTAEPGDHELIVTYADNGIGVPDTDKERIFEMGFGKNTGFGLFLSREILTLNGITIRETGVFGRGARFEIAVPEKAFRHPEA
ncbi:MAG: PAS domain S-box protein [Methanoregula sp.]